MTPGDPRDDATTAAPRGAVRLDSASLFRGEREIVIVHRGQEDRLRITRADKLILTK
jgi:hemin uptake protein HemP